MAIPTMIVEITWKNLLLTQYMSEFMMLFISEKIRQGKNIIVYMQPRSIIGLAI